MDIFHGNAEQLGQHAVINHVAHQLAKLGIRADRSHEFVKRHRIKNQVVPQSLQIKLLIKYNACAGIQRHHIFLGRLRVHSNQEINLLSPGDIAVLGGTDRIPRGESRDVRRK